MADVLTDEEVDNRLPRGWSRSGAEIERAFEFDDYLEGVEFAVECAEVAEEEFHHPEITIGYGEVTVRLTTHEADGITDRDLHMAELFNELL